MAVTAVKHSELIVPPQMMRMHTEDPLAHVLQKAMPKQTFQRASEKIICWEASLEKALPNSQLQIMLDSIGNAFEEGLQAFFTPLNEEIDTHDVQAPYLVQLIEFLIKTPFRVLRNDIVLLYQIAKALLYTSAHPLKAIFGLKKLLINFFSQIAKTDNWAKIGATMAGAAIGSYLGFLPFKAIDVRLIGFINREPFLLAGLFIGIGLIALGLTISSIKTAMNAEKHHKCQAVFDHVINQVKRLPEHFINGLPLGFLLSFMQIHFMGECWRFGIPIYHMEGANQLWFAGTIAPILLGLRSILADLGLVDPVVNSSYIVSERSRVPAVELTEFA